MRAGTLTPSFDSDELNYTLVVPTATASVTLTFSLEDDMSSAKIVETNGTGTRHSGLLSIPLAYGCARHAT